MERLSPAKVNLYLRVLGKRTDGYHNIATLMQKISLYDELIFRPIKQGIVIKCPDSALPEDENNIVYRAARSLLSLSSFQGGIEITLKKNIPLAAGLGGGSSDAATTLMALNDLFHLGLTRDRLIQIGATLGADVPFFIFGQRAWAFGIGDKLLPAPENLPKMWFVLINPRFGVSTKKVYEGLNFGLTKGLINYSIPRFCTVNDLAVGLHNDLEKVTLKDHPKLSELKELLMGHGAKGALMTGSGPTVFGLFAEEDAAVAAEDSLKKTEAWSVFRAHSL
ncbi:MAG: 4-(cytidine 5'-diphospho)-2-C-methyl-D-erythritol kinase [Deltaproteobacteria bacterium]|nr:4-(cytidine 5'-diphospho)-2-C-methyl-D-erythritol kinase [Deltaproteobacteria bacterium]